MDPAQNRGQMVGSDARWADLRGIGYPVGIVRDPLPPVGTIQGLARNVADPAANGNAEPPAIGRGVQNLEIEKLDFNPVPGLGVA